MSVKKIFFIIFLLIVLIYVTNLTAIPNKIILFTEEKLDLDTVYGIYKNKEEVVTTSLETKDNNIIKEETVHLSLFNLINIKDINVTTVEQKYVVPLRKFNWIKTIF